MSAPPRIPVRWLNASVVGFCLASLLSDAGHEAATAALPALLAALGAAPCALGIIEGVSDGLVTFAKLGGGILADRPRLRKPVVASGYLLTGLSTGLFALATGWLHILLVRCIGWFARGVRGPARDAMLADAVPGEAVGRAFGFHRAMDTLGAVVGPGLATLLIAALPLREVFLWTLVPGVLAGLSIVVLVRPQRAPASERQPVLSGRLAQLPLGFRRYLRAVFLFGLGDFARTLLILRATQLFTPEFGTVRATATAMALYVGHNLLYAAASYPVGRLADRLSARRLLVLGYGLGTMTAVLAAAAVPSLPFLIILFAVAGLALAFEDTLEGTITARMVAPSLRGTGYGVLAATNGVGDLLSSSLLGGLWTLAGPGVAFGLAAALCLLGTIALAVQAE